MVQTVGFSLKKWVLIILSVLALGVIICGVFLPTILSTEAGKNFLIRRVERNTGAKLKISALSFSWTGEQRIENFDFIDGKGLDISFDTLSSDCSFWNLIFRNGSVGNTHIANPKITFAAKRSKERVEALEKAAAARKKPKGGVWSDFSGHLTISNGQITVINGGNDVISIYGVKIDLNLGETDSFFFQGKTRKNEQLGTFLAEGKRRKYLEGSVTVNSFPVEGLDQVVSLLYPKYQGLLLATLGDTLNATIKSTPNQGRLNIEANIRSPRLLVDLNPIYGRGAFELVEAGRIALTVKPYLFNHFNTDLVLQNDAQTELRLEKGTLPFAKKTFHFSEAGGVGNFYFSGAELLLKKIQQTLYVDQVSASFTTQNLGSLIQMNLKSAMRYERGAEASVNGTLSIQNALKKAQLPSA